MLFFSLFLSIIAFSQEKLTHSITQTPSGTLEDEMEDSYKYEYTYDLVGNLVKEEYYYISNDTWIFGDETAYSYNDDNKVLEEIYSSESGPSYRTTYEYDTNGLLLSAKTYDFDSVWILSSQYTMTYENGVLVSYIGESDDGVEKVEFNYNSDNLLSSIYEFVLEDDVYVYDYRTAYVYDANDNLSRLIYSYYNGSGWDDDGEVFYTYDASGNITLEEEVYSEVYSSSYTYNAEALLSDYSHPFKDKTGLDYLFDPSESYIINKLLTRTSNDGNVTTFYYSDDPTASSNEFSNIVVSVFPNPVVDYLTVESDVKIEEIEVSDFSGKNILSTGKTKVDFTNLKSGVYLVKIISEEGTTLVKKILKN